MQTLYLIPAVLQSEDSYSIGPIHSKPRICRRMLCERYTLMVGSTTVIELLIESRFTVAPIGKAAL